MDSTTVQPSDPFDLDDATDNEQTPSVQPSTESEQGRKKKRKAWGQAIPDFKVVLPPRKRAKTAEEKEQRKNERVIRNRRAADKSRQRQKAAYADLEITKARMEQENVALRQALAQYQIRFGELPGVSTTFTEIATNNGLVHQPPLALPSDASATTFKYEDSPGTSVDLDSFSSVTSPQPTLSYDSPRLSQSMERSTSLTPALFPPQDQSLPPLNEAFEPLLSLANPTEVPDLTQYPAAILCDLQCQSETSTGAVQQMEISKQFNFSLHLLNLTILMTIYDTFSTSTLSPICQMFRTLVRNLSTISIEPASLDNHFPLIHSLITTPTSQTTRPIFRMKLLSRLLACSPSLARLLEAATDRALQRVVDDDSILEDRRAGQQWASLLTTKWAIKCVEREHQRYRLMVDHSIDLDQNLPEMAPGVRVNNMEGVDYKAVERSSWRWRSENLASKPEGACVPGPDVH